MTTSPQKNLAILVGGGPAPGINSVISAATIRAQLEGVTVLGIRDGFQWLMQGNIEHVHPLTIDEVSRIHFRGGSHIGIARANPTKDPQLLENAVISLLRLNVSRLITIGGDDTAFSSMKLAEKAEGRIAVVHVPKTIDNDLDLPPDVDTFGFQTARHVGVEIVKNLMVDARTTSRWYFVIAMGRKAGHLALGIGKAAGATITLIPEEFGEGHVRFSELVDTLTGAVVKRLSYDRPDGVAILAEGLLEKLHPDDLALIDRSERDQHGNLRFSEIDFGDALKQAVLAQLKAKGIKHTIVSKDIGYELRCTDPIPSDIEYTRDLGYCAARFVIEGGSGAMVSMQGGRFKPVPFEDLIDLNTGRARVRMVDIDSDRYRIARSYMVRLKREDFDDPMQCARLSSMVQMTPEEFTTKYGYLVAREAAPMSMVSRMPPPPPKPSFSD